MLQDSWRHLLDIAPGPDNYSHSFIFDIRRDRPSGKAFNFKFCEGRSTKCYQFKLGKNGNKEIQIWKEGQQKKAEEITEVIGHSQYSSFIVTLQKGSQWDPDDDSLTISLSNAYTGQEIITTTDYWNPVSVTKEL